MYFGSFLYKNKEIFFFQKLWQISDPSADKSQFIPNLQLGFELTYEIWGWGD